MPFSQTLLPEFEEEMKNTRRILECVPDGKFDFQPHPKSMTLGQLATHVATLPGWTNSAVDMDVLDMPSDFKPEFMNTRAELLAAFDKGVAEARAKLVSCSDEKWQQTWTFKVDGKTILEMPRAVVTRSMIINHLIHHRAQLGVYLRLNDVAFPGMYGPSADEPVLGKAQAAA
jgi:uncharacterized damage-inducible protein DinB